MVRSGQTVMATLPTGGIVKGTTDPGVNRAGFAEG